MTNTPIFGFRLVAESTTESGKAASANENALIAEALFKRRVESRSTAAPPGSPADADVYIVPDGSGSPAPSGAFAGHENEIAIYYNGWLFVAAVNGPIFYVADEGIYVKYDDSGSPAAWAEYTAPTSAFKGARAYASGATSITASNTVIALASESYDTDALHDNATNNSRITVDEAGYWEFWGEVTWDSSSAYVYTFCGLRLNGTTFIGEQQFVRSTSSSTSQKVQVHSGPVSLSVNDYVELLAAGSPTSNCRTGEYATWLAARKVG